MNLINQSFFVGEINIPNTNVQAVSEKLSYFINKYEPECLLKILGYPLYRVFGNEASQRMTDLINGAEYFDALGNVNKFKGLIHDTNYSLIAYYIYYFFQKSSITESTGVSTKLPDSEAGKTVSPADKMISAWNNFATESQSLISFLWFKGDVNDNRVYPEFSNSQYWSARFYANKENVFGI